jgi:hypothetical protein
VRKLFSCLRSDVGISVLQAIEYLGQPVWLIGLHHGSHVPGKGVIPVEERVGKLLTVN